MARLPSRLDRVLVQLESEGGLTTRPVLTPMIRGMDAVGAEIRWLTYSVLLSSGVLGWLLVAPSRALAHTLLLVADILLAAVWIRTGVRLARLGRRRRPS